MSGAVAAVARNAAGGIWAGYTSDALALAHFSDIDLATLRAPQQHPERVHPLAAQRVCNWYLPPFDSPFYGGIMTVLRLANHLLIEHGVRSRFLICGSADARQIRKLVGKAFIGLQSSSVICLDSSGAIATIPPSDYSVATLWTTAYVLLGAKNTGLKFYLIQDFEPLFYPAGSTYAQAELTYRFGFYGIANTQSLKTIYERDYGGVSTVLVPCIDPAVFYPPIQARRRSGAQSRLFYYARPGTPRNGFELAAQALKILKGRMGAGLDIVCAGANWQPADFGLDGVVRAVGMLPYGETGNLYRSCDAGLALMMTKHPSYLPFELMACGAIVVANENDANTWFLRDGENCLLAPSSATCLAEALQQSLSNDPALETIRQNAARRIQEQHSDWSRSMRDVTAFMFELSCCRFHGHRV